MHLLLSVVLFPVGCYLSWCLLELIRGAAFWAIVGVAALVWWILTTVRDLCWGRDGGR
jgi:hypothetical protein